MKTRSLLVIACALGGALPASAQQPASMMPPFVPVETARDLWGQGQTWPQFRAAIDDRVALWERTIGLVAVPDAVVQRARGLGDWKLLLVADDDCSDSGNVIPYLARLSELAPNLQLRIVGEREGIRVRETHRTPDRRMAIPTLLILDETFHDTGCWVERPAQLQHWFITRGRELMDTDVDSYRREKQGFYDFDHGASTLDEVLTSIEQHRCGIDPRAY